MRMLSTTDCRILMLRAIVVRTFASSVEVFVQAQAEDHAGALRWTNDALFTLTCGPTSDAHRKLPRIIHAPGSGSCRGPSARPQRHAHTPVAPVRQHWRHSQRLRHSDARRDSRCATCCGASTAEHPGSSNLNAIISSTVATGCIRSSLIPRGARRARPLLPRQHASRCLRSSARCAALAGRARRAGRQHAGTSA